VNRNDIIRMEEVMKRKSVLRSPFAPLIFLILILGGYAFGAQGNKTKEEKVIEAMESAVKEVQEEKKEQVENTPVPKNSIETTVTDAEKAIKAGKNLSLLSDHTYAEKIMKDYCSRIVIECSITGMKRYSEDLLYRQSFDTLTGYMNLVRLTAEEETTASFMLVTDLKDVTPIVVFPDQSYVVINTNEEVICPIPQGDSTILYIGDGIRGTIELRLEENEKISGKRM